MTAESLPGAFEAHDHAVRFYQDDDALSDIVGRFLHEGLGRGEGAVVIATEAHRRGFRRRLSDTGIDVDTAVASGQLVSLDAEATLSELMLGSLESGRPDPAAFRRVIGGLVERLHDGGRRRGVRAYGEMVSVLFQHGNATATVRLEDLWNELAFTHRFALYCAYPLRQFDRAADAGFFDALCARHSQVFPAEPHGDPSAIGDQGRQIAVLQQRAQALEAEIAERRRVESSLRLICEASAALAGSLDYNEALARVAALAAGSIADWCAFDVLEADGSLRQLAAASRDRVSGAGLIEPLATRLTPAGSDAAHAAWSVLSSGKTETRDVSDPALRGRGLTTCLRAALKANGRVHGVLTLASDRARPFGPDELMLAEDLAGRAALAIETASLCDQLRRADRRKDEFLATLSHELRSPLNAIVGWTHLLRTGSLDGDGTRRALETIARNAGAQNRLIGDILDLQRLSSGKLRLTLGAVDLAAVVEAAADTVRPAAQAKGLDLVVAVDREVGTVLGDGDRLQQVVWNLLSNAVKFTPEGRVEIRLTREGAYVEIVVADDGPGIGADFLPYVFDRFRQGDASATRRHGGLGLGLAIARTLVELHGGTIEAANRTPHGALFRVVLPRTAAGTTACVSASADPPPRSPVRLDGIKVLVVDDDLDAREVLASILGERGAEVFVAVSGETAMPLLRRERPHLLLCDIEMPGEDGYNFLRKVRALAAHEGAAVPAAALTGHARPEDSLRALNAGFQAHVAKPVHPEGLVAVVDRLVRDSRRPS